MTTSMMPLSLLPATLMAPGRTDRFEFVHSRDGTIHGVYVYVSLYSGQVNHADSPDLSGTRRVYNFKRYGKCHEWVARAVEQAKADYNCDSVMVVPGSTPETTQLQAMFGLTIRRTTTVPRRKYDHHTRLLPGYGQTVEFPDHVSGRVLLVDDVCTTGETIRWFAAVLEKRGCEVVLFCLGLNRKLIASSAPGGTQHDFLDGWHVFPGSWQW